MRTVLRSFIPLAAVLWLVLPGTASAQTFCVNNPTGCVGPAYSLHEALLTAESNGAGTRDTIRIGPGAITDIPDTDVAGSPVDIVGESSTSTILRTSTTNYPTLAIKEPTSTVSHLQFQITGTGDEIALQLAGSANHIQITTSGTQHSSAGIEFLGTAGSLSDSIVNLGYTPDEVSQDVLVDPGASATITDSRLVGMHGAVVSGGTLEIHRTRIWGVQAVQATSGGYILIADSLVRSPGPYKSNYQPFALGAAGDGISLLDANRVTAYGDGSQYSTGISVDPNNVQGAGSIVSITDSVLWNFARVAWLIQYPGTTSTFDSQWSAYDQSAPIHLDPGAAHNSADDFDLAGLDPGFADPTSGVFALRHDSPLIDAADPAYSAAGTLDMAGNDRVRDGDGKNGARLDIGAYEYQHAAPKVSASATPSTVSPGSPVGFIGSASDLDVADSLGYSWSFDDGATAAGPTVSHSFATAGTHTGTLTVTDVTGLKGSAVATVSVVVPPPPAAPADPPAAPPVVPPSVQVTPTPLRAPSITHLRMSPRVFGIRHGTTVRFTLSQSATVVIRIERRRGGRWVKADTITRVLRSGRIAMRFHGRIGRHRLGAGRYRMRLSARATATPAGPVSHAAVARFRVVA